MFNVVSLFLIAVTIAAQFHIYGIYILVGFVSILLAMWIFMVVVPLLIGTTIVDVKVYREVASVTLRTSVIATLSNTLAATTLIMITPFSYLGFMYLPLVVTNWSTTFIAAGIKFGIITLRTDDD